MDDLLFNSGDLTAALEAQGRKMREAVEAEPEESLKQADVDEWAVALAYHFAVACPELKTDDVWREPDKDVTVDVSWDSGRYFSDYASDLAHNYAQAEQLHPQSAARASQGQRLGADDRIRARHAAEHRQRGQ